MVVSFLFGFGPGNRSRALHPDHNALCCLVAIFRVRTSHPPRNFLFFLKSMTGFTAKNRHWMMRACTMRVTAMALPFPCPGRDPPNRPGEYQTKQTERK
jgi:hypothetical protein